VRLKDNTGIS